jgi:hypothetical protein
MKKSNTTDPSLPNSEAVNRLEFTPAGPSQDSPGPSIQEPGIKIPKDDEYDTWNLDAARNRQKKDRRVKVVTIYRVAKKAREGAFFRVNPNPAYQIDVLLHTEKDERGMEGDTYFVDWRFADEVLASDWAMFFQPARLYLAIERHSTKPYVHYVKSPRDGQTDNDWWVSSRTVTERAMREWVQPYNAGAGYDYHPAQRDIPDPVWPVTPFGQILQIAFKGRLIDSWDHEVMKSLVGA